jgi:hypothetical protein
MYLMQRNLNAAIAGVIMSKGDNSPRNDDNEVHDVPGVPQVGVGVEHEAHGDNLGAHLHSEDAHEDWLQLLKLSGH